VPKIIGDYRVNIVKVAIIRHDNKREEAVSSALDRLKNLTAQISSYELARKENMQRLKLLFDALGIGLKVSDFDAIFDFKAINLSGVSLSSDDLGTIKQGKYIQIIAITYDKEAKVKNKNSSLGYFGRSERVEPALREQIVEFVLRWRFEKSFRTLEHYHGMITSLTP
jgi:phosphoglucomutase